MPKLARISSQALLITGVADVIRWSRLFAQALAEGTETPVEFLAFIR